MDQLPIVRLLVTLQGAALVCLCLRMWWTRLYRVYHYFFIYLILDLLQTIVGPLFPVQGRLYLYFWMTSEGLVLVFFVLVVLETYSLVLRELSGIASAARRYIKIVIACALMASFLLVGLERTPATIPQYFLVCERAVISSLLVFVLLCVGFLAYYPVPLNRNTLSYSVGFAVYLLIKTITLFVANQRYYLWRQVDIALLTFSAGCLLFWLFALSRRGEGKTVLVGHHWGVEDERRIVLRLKAINESLLRTAKK